MATAWWSLLLWFILQSSHYQHQDLEIFNQASLELEFSPLDTSSEEPIFQFTPIFRFLDHFYFLSQLWWTLIWYNLIGIWRSDLLCSSSVVEDHSPIDKHAEQCWSSDISCSDGLWSRSEDHFCSSSVVDDKQNSVEVLIYPLLMHSGGSNPDGLWSRSEDQDNFCFSSVVDHPPSNRAFRLH